MRRHRQVQDLRVALAGALRRERPGGLLRDRMRPSRIPPLGPDMQERVVALTLADMPRETRHWTADAMAKAAGISASAFRHIWMAHELQPHRWRQCSSCSTIRSSSISCAKSSTSMSTAGSRHRAVRRREEPDTGARPHPVRPAYEEWEARNHDPRLQGKRCFRTRRRGRSRTVAG